MRLRISLGCVGVVGLLLGACSSDSGGEGGGGGPMTCAQAAEAVCAKIEGCFPLVIASLWGSQAVCVERTQKGCEADTGAPDSNVTPDSIGSCVSAWTGTSCDSFLAGDQPTACDIPGTRANGEACGADSQCQSTFCDRTSACGTCAPRAAAGGACTETDGCQAGLVCATGLCATPVAAGGSCTEPGQCTGNLICKGGVCATPGAAGAPCDAQNNDCDGLAGLYCDPQTKVCKLVSIAKPGQPCGLVNGSYVGCEAQGECAGMTATAPGTCSAPAADGAPCDLQNGPSCLEPAECVNGACQLPNPASCG